jgi:hypothetical protein
VFPWCEVLFQAALMASRAGLPIFRNGHATNKRIGRRG